MSFTDICHHSWLRIIKIRIYSCETPQPLAFGEAVIDWETLSDPESKVFQTMPKSQQTLRRCVADFIQTENLAKIGLLHAGVFKQMKALIKATLRRQFFIPDMPTWNHAALQLNSSQY